MPNQTTTNTNADNANPWANQESTTTVETPANDNPWASAGQSSAAVEQTSSANTSDAANPWGTASETTDSAATTTSDSADWLSAPSSSADVGSADSGFQISQIWDGSLPIQDWINQGIGWFVAHFRPAFQAVRHPIDATLSGIQDALLYLPTLWMIAIITLLAWQLAGRAIAIGSLISLLVIAMLGVWPEAMVTLALVLTSLLFCLIIGLPLGILLASSDRTQRIMRPFLDAMQTTPAFVYLVPVVMLFGIGNVPGVIVTIVFALPPLVRLTNLGIRQVRGDLIEAAKAYGASPMQMLFKVQLPLAMPSIMAGINQALMLSLSMVVIASMIAVGGLGQMVLRGIGRLDMGLATIGGVGIVLLAIMLDRITQAMGENDRTTTRWHDTGPIGLIKKLTGKKATPQ